MKIRLDQYLVDNHLAPDLGAAQALILSGDVYVEDTVIDKVGTRILPSSNVRIKERCPFVSRGGYKLLHSLKEFKIDVSEFICLDIGASTGGFTDCLLQAGAQKVYAIDVAYGQLAWKLRQDPKVIPIERYNARNLTLDIIGDDTIDLVVMDVSFISLTKILPAIVNIFPKKIKIISLIKPQFELAKHDISPGGVVVDPALHQKAINKIENFVGTINLSSNGVVKSPILGPKGNSEFLIYLTSANKT